MGKIKEIYTDIQEKIGEDIEITQEIFNQHLVEIGIIKEKKNLEEEE